MLGHWSTGSKRPAGQNPLDMALLRCAKPGPARYSVPVGQIVGASSSAFPDIRRSIQRFTC
jgi:hypothetical protein